MAKYFVTVQVTVEEQGAKETLNTPGGDQLVVRRGGPVGLPFFAFLDSGGALIVNSIIPGGHGGKTGNIGHPYEPHEVDWYQQMLAKAAPRMTGEERGTIEKWLPAQKK